VSKAVFPWLFLLPMLILSKPAAAARFSNSFVEFELAPGWECAQEGSEWLCQVGQGPKNDEAVIVVAAKPKGAGGKLEQYLNYLRAPRRQIDEQGRALVSEPKYAKVIKINEQDWVSSLHSDSELSSYLTRYLVTTSGEWQIGVSYSVKKPSYQKYYTEFEALVKSLKIRAKAGVRR
jgi:hypothetical protein